MGEACESAPARQVARRFGLPQSTVRSIDLRYLERWAAARRKPALRQMGVDEIHLGKKQKFLTVVCNLQTAEPLWFGRERKKETLDEFFQTALIAREVLRNGFQHAGASRIEAAIRYDPNLFRLRIRDDGKGIDAAVLQEGARSGHWGLPEIRERAKRIGARLALWSESGAGTEVELTVPASVAYAASDVRRRFGLFRIKTKTS